MQLFVKLQCKIIYKKLQLLLHGCMERQSIVCKQLIWFTDNLLQSFNESIGFALLRKMQATLAKLEGIEEELDSHQSTSLKGVLSLKLYDL